MRNSPSFFRLLGALQVTLSLSLAAQARAAEISNFDILPGKLHKGGHMTATSSDTETPGVVKVTFDYEIIKKNLVPIPNSYLIGSYFQMIPEDLLTEAGYLALEEAGAIEAEGATIIHQGRAPYRGHQDAHAIQIIPDDGSFELQFLYHPSIPGLGWDDVKLILHTPIPLLGNYWIEGVLKTGS